MPLINNVKANIVISCPDKPWIIKVVTQFLFEYWANISLLEEHNEDGYFFMRIEWELDNFKLGSGVEFFKKFQSIQNEFKMELSLDFWDKRKKIWLFCSKEWHCLLDIISRYALWELNIDIAYVASNSLNLKDLVEKFDIPFYYVETRIWSFDHEKQFLEIIKNNPTDIIWLARYMKILSENFIKEANQKIINVHHSFLPSFVWAKPYDEAHERWVKLIWATSHYVIPELDGWPIIEQKVKRVKHSHAIDNLKLIGKECEKEVFAFAIRKHIENKLVVYKNRTIVFE